MHILVVTHYCLPHLGGIETLSFDSIIQRIKFFRERTEIPVGYTIDAGPNIHLLYFLENKTEVQTFIKRELLNFCENRRYIDDGIGDGPMKIL